MTSQQALINQSGYVDYDLVEAVEQDWLDKGFVRYEENFKHLLRPGVIIKYISDIEGSHKFRSGGLITYRDDDLGYIVCSFNSGQKGFSVQLENIVAVWVRARRHEDRRRKKKVVVE